jgi:hypothetical protein
MITNFSHYIIFCVFQNKMRLFLIYTITFLNVYAKYTLLDDYNSDTFTGRIQNLYCLLYFEIIVAPGVKTVTPGAESFSLSTYGFFS